MSTKKFDFKNTPTLQHAVYLIGPTVEDTAENIRRLRRSTPPYRLDVARQLIARVFQLRADDRPEVQRDAVDWAKRQAETIPDPALRKATKEILACVETYLDSVTVRWFRPVATFPYPIGRGLAIPVNPLGMISDGEKIRLLWAQMWRTRTLNPDQFNIHGAVLERAVFAIETDITELEWMEMSIPAGAKERELRLRGRDAYALMDDANLAAALDRLATAVQIVNSEAVEPSRRKGGKRDPKNGDLFRGDDTEND